MSSRGKRTILLVEDSLEDRDTVREAAAGRAVDVLHAAALADARAQLRAARARGAAPLLMLLDNNLPDGDGVGFLRELRADHECLPIVMLTTSANPRDIVDCYRAGANAYHVKSVEYTECLATVGAILEYWLERVELASTERPLTDPTA